MKTLTKTFALTAFLATFALLSPSDAQADCRKGECAKKALVTDTTEADIAAADIDEFDFDFDNPFFFSDRFVVNVYNQEDELVYSKSFTKEEAKNDRQLQAILKQSEFLLSIDHQYYYATRAETLAKK